MIGGERNREGTDWKENEGAEATGPGANWKRWMRERRMSKVHPEMAGYHQ